MDSFEWNKIAGAVLGTLVFVFVVKIAAEIVFEPETPEKPGYIVEGVIEEGPAASGPVAETPPDWGTVLASADVAAGKNVADRCLQCHTFEKGGANRIGPNIYGVVEHQRAMHEGYAYSAALRNKGGTWTYDDLFAFLRSPGANIPGTKMSFAGIRNSQDRINLIAFLRSNADAPAAIPAPRPPEPEPEPAEAAANGAKPAEGVNPTGPDPGAIGKTGN